MIEKVKLWSKNK